MKKLYILIICIAVILPGCSSSDSNTGDSEVMNNGVVAIACGSCHSLAVMADGRLWAWGLNGSGQLGDGTTISRNEPVNMMNDVVGAAAGSDHTMAIKADGSLWTWGLNDYGQLGDGTYISKSRPVKIMDDVISIAAGGRHSLAVKSDGSLWVWGANWHGYTVDGTEVPSGNMPAKIIDNVVSVATGASHYIALKTDGSVRIWGDNGYGQLGNGMAVNRGEGVGNIDDAEHVSAGKLYSMVIKADRSLWIWGDLQAGADEPGKSDVPVKIMDDVIAATAGWNHGIAVKEDGSLWSWGNNWYGQLGDGTTTIRNRLLCVMEYATDATAGDYHSMAIKTDGSLWAFGWNKYGQLGDGTNLNKSMPVQVLFDDLLVDIGVYNKGSEPVAQQEPDTEYQPGVKQLSENLFFVTASDAYRVFVREEPDINSGILLGIEAGDTSVRLKSAGQKRLVGSYEWYNVLMPDGGSGWIREDVAVENGEAKPFAVETAIRYYHFDPDYNFSTDRYDCFSPLTIQLRYPAVSKDTQGADIINEKINGDWAGVTAIYDEFLGSDFSLIDRGRYAYLSVDYEVHEYNSLFALVIEYRDAGPDWGGDYSCSVYYYDGKEQKMIDAETYANLAGYKKEDIILAQNNSPWSYYSADSFEDINFYIQYDGLLYADVDFSD